MKYADGQDIEPGDLVTIDERHTGRVVASMDTGRYLPGHEGWACLERGIMVHASFGGPVHYPDQRSVDEDELMLARRDGGVA